MSKKPEILFLAHRIPYPPNKGDKIRSWRLLCHLAKRYRVHVGCFVDDRDDLRYCEKVSAIAESAEFVELSPAIARLKSLQGLVTGSALSEFYYRSHALQQYVEQVRARGLLAEIAFSSTMAQFIEGHSGKSKKIIDFCDADSEKWREYSQTGNFAMRGIYAREARLLAKREQEIIGWADHCFAISPQEALLFSSTDNDSAGIDWWCNGVDTRYFDPEVSVAAAPQSIDVVFTGAMDYRPNIDAVLEFVRAAWQKIRATKPDATFAVVGARPDAQLLALDGQQGITVTGHVDDIRVWLGAARVAIAPMKIARGVQNKVLEAMAMGVPMVASTPAITGIACADAQSIFIADDTQAVVDGVLSLLSDITLANQYGANARKAVVETHSWAAQLQRFDAAFAGI